jgi:hypothetical protein
MLVRATRWFLIGAPVVAGILVLIFGTAGSISTTFGIVLIGIGPIVWMWNWLVRMSFDEGRPEQPHVPDQPRGSEPSSKPGQHEPAPRHREAADHRRARVTRTPRKRS